MTLRLRLAALFAAVLLIVTGLFVIALRGQIARELSEARRFDPAPLREEAMQEAMNRLSTVWLVAGVPIMGLCFLLGFLVATRSVRHLREINDQLSRLEPSGLGNRIAAPDNDPEVAELVLQINSLLSRVGRSYDELSEFSSRVAHELRTPLTILRMRLEESAAGLPPEVSEDLQEEVGRLSRLVERSLSAARAQGGRLKTNIAAIDLSALLGELREGYDALAEEKSIGLVWLVAPGLEVSADKDLLRQILHNLLDNAMRHGAGSATVVAEQCEGGQLVEVTVRNSVAGPPESARGSGIGLRLVKALVGSMQGMEFSAGGDAGEYTALLVCPANSAAQAVSPVLGGVVRDTAWVAVRGRGTFQNSVAVAEFAKAALKNGCKKFAVDFSACSGLDSTFLGTIAAIGSRLHRGGGTVAFAGAGKEIRRLLAEYGLDSLASSVVAPEQISSANCLAFLPLDAAFETKRRAVIDAHEALAALSPLNAERFRDALDFLKHRVPET
jgi:signal transduction histidine kinase/anti-anti-sigma regulatory factor